MDWFGSQRRAVVSDRAAARERSIFAAAKIIRKHVSTVSGVSANTATASATSAGCSASIVTTRLGPGNQARCPEGLFHSRWRISCPSTGPLTGDIATRYADGPSCLRALPVFAVPSDRFAPFSMTKSVVAILVGIALDEGRNGSFDDLAKHYLPALKGTVWSRVSIRNLLRMSSGVT